MDKKSRIIILTSIAVLIIIFALWLAFSKQNNMTTDEDLEFDNSKNGELVEDANSDEYKATSTSNPASQITVSAEYDWREAIEAPDFVIEFMSKEEMLSMDMSTDKRVQVLSRDKESGVVLAYKIIESDEDIINAPSE